MKIDIQAHGTIAVLVPHGPLATDALSEFRAQLTSAAEQRQSRVVVDLRDVPYLDSAGIEALLELCGERRAAATRPKLSHLNETCREALYLTDALGRLDVFDTTENAVRSYKR